MKKTLTRLTAAVALACAATLPAQAHNAWLLPSTSVLSKADWITVDAAVSNDLFFFNHVPLNVQGLHITAPDGSALQPQNPHQGKLRNVFDLHLRAAWHLPHRHGKQRPVRQLQRCQGPAQALARHPEKFAAEVPADAQELKVTQAVGRIETFVTLGKPSAIAATGQGLELLPTQGRPSQRSGRR